MTFTKSDIFTFGLPLGSQYYRAPTPPPEDWAKDLDLMAANGMNTVKIWAQWRWNHPEEKRFDFDDLQTLMDLSQERSLKVVINTLFDVAPAWLYQKYPDSLMIRQDGRQVGPMTFSHRQIGGAPGPCLHHPAAKELRVRFLEAVVDAFKNHPALWVWDLWNEPELTCGLIRGGAPSEQVCWCQHSRNAFMGWLQNKYGSLENLNYRWKRRYLDWEEVELPIEPSVYMDWIDWRMFFRDTLTGEMEMRAEVTRKIDQIHPVMCHVVNAPIFNISSCASDDFELAKPGDLFGNSSAGSELSADLTRSAAGNRPLICSEAHALPGMTLYRPVPLSRKKLEEHLFISLFRGIKGFLFWQFRAELLGMEAPAWGMTRPDGSPEPWLGEFKDLSKWLQSHADFILEANPEPASVAILVIPENEIFFYCHDRNLDRYWSGVLGAYDLLREAGISVDFVHPSGGEDGSWDRYSTIILPMPYAIPPKVVTSLRDFVEKGGRLVSEGFLGALNPDTGYSSKENPGMGLSEVFGCREYAVIPEQAMDPAMAYGVGSAGSWSRVVLTLTEPIGKVASGSVIHCRFAQQSLEPIGGQALAIFPDGAAAIVEHRYGNGTTCYIGAWIFQAYRETHDKAIMELVKSLVGIPTPATWSEEVNVETMNTRDRCWILLRNPHPHPVRAQVHTQLCWQEGLLLPESESISVKDGVFEIDLAGNDHRIVEVRARS